MAIEMKVENGVLIYCFGEEKVVEIPEGVKEIKDRAFNGLDSVEKLILPDTLEVIGSYIFNSKTIIKSLTCPKNLKVIKDSAFFNTKIEEIILNDGLEVIEDDAINVTRIKEITIPNSVKEIGYKGVCAPKIIVIGGVKEGFKRGMVSVEYTDYEYYKDSKGNDITTGFHAQSDCMRPVTKYKKVEKSWCGEKSEVIEKFN